MRLDTLVGSIKQKYSQHRQLNKLESLIKESGKFDVDFYTSTYSSQSEMAVKKPIRHFITEGASMGFNPSKWFNTNWYINQYEDIKEEGINPLVHYILYGRREGRKPNPNQFATALEKQIDKIKNGVVENLWGGYSAPALQELEAIYQNTGADLDLRFFAAWHAARWYYFVEDFEKALSISKLVRELSTDYHLDKTAVLMHSFCLMKLGEIERAKLHLFEYLESNPNDADALLSLSNLYTDPADRLMWINDAFERNGFAPIEFDDEQSSISFKALYATAPAVGDERLVSVIIPTFNAGERLEIAIQSLLNQSWTNLEIIVVDDCSTDDTPELVRRLSLQDSRVKLVQQPQNGGAYRARNAGLKIAKGDFLTTHDGDDWSHPQKIEAQIAYLDSWPKVMGVSTFWIRATDDLQFQHNWRLNPRLIHWSHSSFMFRRQVLEELGQWDTVIAGGDTEFIWRVQAKYGKWAFKRIHKEVPMAFALDDEASLTRNKATHIKTMHNGLRHIYRSGCQWWHKNNNDELKTEGDDTRAFPAPRSMIVRGDNNTKGDCIFISDFSDKRFKDSEFELINTLIESGQSVLLYHVPEYGKIYRPLCDRFFELLHFKNAEVCVFGMEVETTNVVFLNPNLLKFVPEQLAEVSGRRVFVSKRSESEISSEHVVEFINDVNEKDIVITNISELSDSLINVT